jgi:GNAT superfamily N-acetyltransferase
VIIGVGKLTEMYEQLDECLNHGYTRERVEDQLGLQQVNWGGYEAFDKTNMVLLMTAKDDGKLAGFAMYIMYVHPNHPRAFIGHCQFLIVPPAYRGKGLGRKLIECAMSELKQRGCTHIIHGRRMVYDVEPLFTKLGFDKFEESYIKEIK